MLSTEKEAKKGSIDVLVYMRVVCFAFLAQNRPWLAHLWHFLPGMHLSPAYSSVECIYCVPTHNITVYTTVIHMFANFIVALGDISSNTCSEMISAKWY